MVVLCVSVRVSGSSSSSSSWSSISVCADIRVQNNKAVSDGG